MGKFVHLYYRFFVLCGCILFIWIRFVTIPCSFAELKKKYASSFSDTTRNRKYHYKKELFEFGPQSNNISLSQVCGRCHVFYARENHLNDVLKSKEMLTKYTNEQIYVCRYMLVKKTVYELQPVAWSSEEEERQNRSGEFSTDDDLDDEDDNDEYYQSMNLSDEINELYLSTVSEPAADTEDHMDNGNDLRVTPIKIKIFDNSIVKVKRNDTGSTSKLSANTTSTRKSKATDDDKMNTNDISPSKRSRYEDEANQNYLTESPRTDRCYSPHETSEKIARMTKVKKNLLDQSFNSTTEDFEDSFHSPLGSPNNSNSYTSKLLDNENSSSLKMVLRKKVADKIPLKEHHDNVGSPRDLRYDLLQKITSKNEPTTPKSRRSILKPQDCSGPREFEICPDFGPIHVLCDRTNYP